MAIRNFYFYVYLLMYICFMVPFTHAFDVSEIYSQMLCNYKKLDYYNSHGKIIQEFIYSNYTRKEIFYYEIVYDRTNSKKYPEFSYVLSNSNRSRLFIIWSDGDKLFTYYSTTNSYWQNKSIEYAIISMTAITGPTFQVDLLFSRYVDSKLVTKEMKDNSIISKDEMVNNQKCFYLKSNNTAGGWDKYLWISKNDYLLRKNVSYFKSAKKVFSFDPYLPKPNKEYNDFGGKFVEEINIIPIRRRGKIKDYLNVILEKLIPKDAKLINDPCENAFPK